MKPVETLKDSLLISDLKSEKKKSGRLIDFPVKDDMDFELLDKKYHKRKCPCNVCAIM
ncbi:hypothetical protein A3Q56_05430 [Intoshia linei]|uniref:Uncharacterized protein n=1 Tax=Intoshia linei TaxID=1819745 RepID=A0A177B0B7_9BILA|nr:hypothetical protein A3Q56_05430 [Intoshia linei]